MVLWKEIAFYAHWLGIIMGLGGAILADIYSVRNAVFKPISNHTVNFIHGVAKIVTTGLVLLIFSGGILLAYKVFAAPEFMLGTKIWTKLTIVFMLCVNGINLHTFVLPALESRIGKTLFSDQVSGENISHIFAGAISFVSWTAAFSLGFMKTLPFGLSVAEGLTLYFLAIALLGCAGIGLLMIIQYAKGAMAEIGYVRAKVVDEKYSWFQTLNPSEKSNLVAHDNVIATYSAQAFDRPLSKDAAEIAINKGEQDSALLNNALHFSHESEPQLPLKNRQEYFTNADCHTIKQKVREVMAEIEALEQASLSNFANSIQPNTSQALHS
jgi:hypothetical protein